MGFFVYISSIIMEEKSKKLKEVNLTLQEWLDALRMPTPVRNKKKYRRTKKHKNKGDE